jgi:type I restriction enzyme S subunit
VLVGSVLNQELPKGWTLVKLGEIGEIVSGITLGRKVKNGTTRRVPYLRVANVKDGHLDLDSVYTIEATEKEIEKCKLQFGDLLLTEGGDPDKLGRGTFWANQIPECIHQNHIFRIRFDLDKYSSEFIALQIGSSLGKSYFLSHAKQTTGIATINQTVLAGCPLILPTLEEQKRIAAIARKCDRLRRTRRFTQQLSDTYLQSAFIEMFGDPAKNPKQWPKIALEDVLVSVKDGPHVSPKYSESGVPFLSTRNIRPGEIIWDDLKYIPHEDAEKFWKRDKPMKGDILYTKGGTTGLAKAIDFDREIAVWVHIAVLKVRPDLVEPLWLENMLNSDYCYAQSQELTFGIVNRDLGLKRMPKIAMYLPPIALQQKFAQIVQRYERLRTQQQEADRQAEHLFQTVLHRAFQGEL